MKLTKKSVANSSRSCGIAIRSIIVAGALLIVVGGRRLARLSISGSTKRQPPPAPPSKRPSTCPSRTNMPRPKRPSPSSRPTRRAATACWRACAPRPNSRQAIRRPRRSSSTTPSRADPGVGAVGAGSRQDPCRRPSAVDTAPLCRDPPAAGAADERRPRTFRHTARELLASSAWRAKDVAAARQWHRHDHERRETPPTACASRADDAAGAVAAGCQELVE